MSRPFEIVVAADDRTGALEVAGELAARLATVVYAFAHGAAPTGRPANKRDDASEDVAAFVRSPPGEVRLANKRGGGGAELGDVVVLDLSSRHLAARSATARAVDVDEIGARRRGHKVDSMLRGNWAAELVGRAAASPVLLVPALPAAGRVCVGGIVRQRREAGDRGVPIAVGAGGDARGGPDDSRPAALLRVAGAVAVTEVAGPAAAADWLASARPGAIAVADAATVDDVTALGRIVATRPDVLVAGPAQALAILLGSDGAASPFRPLVSIGTGPIVVVCGSLHPAARRQLRALAEADPDIVQLSSPPAGPAAPGIIPPDVATAVAQRLAIAAGAAITAQSPAAVVILGGDTAAAVLGDATMVVVGLVASGTPISRRLEGAGPWFVTRSGSFGDDDALVDLVATLRGGAVHPRSE